MYPGSVARIHPDKPAVAVFGGGVQTYGELDRRSGQLASALRLAGLGAGDTVAVVLETRLEWPEVVWAPLRSGMWVAPLNWHLGPDELAYLLADSGARALVTSPALLREMSDAAKGIETVLVLDEDYERLIAAQMPGRSDDDVLGARLLYSGGSTGRPKGIRAPLPNAHPNDAPPRLDGLVKRLGLDADSVFLNAAPCYHAAPFQFGLILTSIGATIVHLPRFDAEDYLAAIAEHRVTHAQVVPTMLVRLLRLPSEVRARYDLSSLQAVITSAAPCPAELKDQIAEWLGPVMHEYYGASEGYGVTHVGPAEAAARPGTVGLPIAGIMHVTDDDGVELSPRQVGTVWFEGTAAFSYSGDEEKTRRSRNDRGWSTVGDLGYLDEDGYLYLTGRAGYTIISGGVNIYPAEIEEALVAHPAVADVAVFGLPDPEYGEQVVAVVQLDSPATAADLIEHVRGRLARFKAPKRVEFVDVLPRLPSGKMNKAALRERYLTDGGSS
ncbi:MAG: AMP-binding protein [Sporichthyaceae bacterium]